MCHSSGHQRAGNAGGTGHLPVERECGERGRRRHAEFARGHRPPWAGRPMHDEVGSDAAQIREYAGQQVEGGPSENFQHRERDRRVRQGQIPPDVEVDLRTGSLDLGHERGEGVVGHHVAAPDKFCHDRQRRVDVTVHTDVEERDGAH